MCETRRSDKAPSEREDASSTAVQPGSPCDAQGTIQTQTPPTRSRPKRHRDVPYLGLPREDSKEWLPDLSIDQDTPLTPMSGGKRHWRDIIADDSPPEPDKMIRSLDDMLEEAQVTKRRKLEVRAPRSKKDSERPDRSDGGDRHGTRMQPPPPVGREMNAAGSQAVPVPHTQQTTTGTRPTRQARNP